jgi:2-polyprenyl-3-methyl-5-hydroxy-6-metoxy-1,4-benzoquinol methylase
MNRPRAPKRSLLGKLRRSMPEPIRKPLRRIRARAYTSGVPVLVRIATLLGARPDPTYSNRLAEEISEFEDQIEIHELPEIYHYWSNKYLRPELERFGYSGPTDFFYKELLASAQRAQGHCKFISIGSGNCDVEVSLAEQLHRTGLRDFSITCMDISRAMLDRGKTLAAQSNVSDLIEFRCEDVNVWRPQESYHAVIANQSLHHVLDLEHLLDAVRDAIGTEGVFLASDIIGRNGHMRWPEALSIVQEFWQALPRRKRFNLQLERYEKNFLDWDCSAETFEGIRAQDILPLLIARFHFEFFFGYANVIDPFIDRSFGFHSDPSETADREFIDRVHARDEAEIQAGRLKPTHMLAKMSQRFHVESKHRRGLSPASCVRDPLAMPS